MAAEPIGNVQEGFNLEDSVILNTFTQHSDFDAALDSLVGYQNGKTDELKSAIVQRYSNLLSATSAHELIVNAPALAITILGHILNFKLKLAVTTDRIFRVRDSSNFPDVYNSFDYFASYLIGYIFAHDEKGFMDYMLQISNGHFKEEEVSQLFTHLRTEFVSGSQQHVTKEYEGIFKNSEPVKFGDKLPTLDDLADINLFEGFTIQVEVEGQIKELLVRVVSPEDERAKERISEARELGYSRFGAGNKKNRKVINYEFGPHTILEVLSLETNPPSEYATAEVMIDPFVGTEGQRLLSSSFSDTNILVESPYIQARLNADSPQEFISQIHQEHHYLPDFIRSRSRPDSVAEVGTLAFKTIDKGRDKPSLPANILGSHMVYLILTMSSAIAQRRGINKMVGIFQEYLQKTLALNGAHVTLDDSRRLDILGINNLGPDGNGTASNLEYYLNHANYFLAGSKILIPADLDIEVDGANLGIPANSYLTIDKSLQHKIKITGPEGDTLWEAGNKDMFTTKGLEIAKQILTNNSVRQFLILHWEELLKNRADDEGSYGEKAHIGHIEGPGFYYQDASTLVNGLITAIEDKKKLYLNLTTPTTMLSAQESVENKVPSLRDIFPLDVSHLPPTPDLPSLNHYNSTTVSASGDTWDRMVEDLRIADIAESNRFIHRELSREAFLQLVGMRKNNQIAINMPSGLDEISFDPEDGALRWDFKAEPDHLSCTILDFTQGQFATNPELLDKCKFILVGHGRQKYLYIIDDVERFEAVRMCRAWATLTSVDELDRRIMEAESQGIKLVGTPLHEAILNDPLLKKLREHTSISVIGQGTAGRPTAKALAQLGIKALTLFELPEETVSLSNTQRLAGQDQIGLSKLMVSATEYQTANPLTQITLGGGLTQESIELLKTTDLVILAADQPAQVLIHEYCFRHGIDVLLGTDIGYGSEVLFFEYSSPDVEILNGSVTLDELANDPKAVLKMLNLVTVLTQGDPETLYAFRARSAGHLAGLPQNQFAPLTNASLLGAYVTSIVRGESKPPTIAYLDPERAVSGKSKFQRLIENMLVLYKTRKLIKKANPSSEV